MEIKRIYIIIFGFILFASCSSKMTIAKINKPSYKIFREDIRQVKRLNKRYLDSDPQTVTKAVDEETYYFERGIKMRSKVIDSLSLLKKDKFVIIDFRTDNNGQRIEGSYFYFDDQTLFAGFKRKDSIANGRVFVEFIPQIQEENRINLAQSDAAVNDIYDVFSTDKIPEILDGGSERTSYLVTVVRDKKVRYYSVSGNDKYRILRLD